MYRTFDLDLAELSHHEGVGLLAYSPLSAGMLSGKYSKGAIPQGSRRDLNSDLFRRYNELSEPVMEAYTDLAIKHELPPSHLALAFCLDRPFMTSVIIGATNMEQLKTDIDAADVALDETLKKGIFEIFRRYPAPM